MTDSSRDLRLIYVLEDDRDVGQIVVRELVRFGFSAEHLTSGNDLLKRHARRPAALCIVDLGLPDQDGLTVVRTLRESGACAVVILTGRGELADRVAGLEIGADDYVTKPFETRELIARVRSVLRRVETRDQAARAGSTAHFSGWVLELASQQLKSPTGEVQDLGLAEAQLLTALLRSPNRILSRDQLLPNRANAPFDRTIDARISRLRKRLGEEPDDPRMIKTVYGVGYMLSATVEWR